MVFLSLFSTDLEICPMFAFPAARTSWSAVAPAAIPAFAKASVRAFPNESPPSIMVMSMVETSRVRASKNAAAVLSRPGWACFAHSQNFLNSGPVSSFPLAMPHFLNS